MATPLGLLNSPSSDPFEPKVVKGARLGDATMMQCFSPSAMYIRPFDLSTVIPSIVWKFSFLEEAEATHLPSSLNFCTRSLSVTRMWPSVVVATPVGSMNCPILPPFSPIVFIFVPSLLHIVMQCFSDSTLIILSPSVVTPHGLSRPVTDPVCLPLVLIFSLLSSSVSSCSCFSSISGSLLSSSSFILVSSSFILVSSSFILVSSSFVAAISYCVREEERERGFLKSFYDTHCAWFEGGLYWISLGGINIKFNFFLSLSIYLSLFLSLSPLSPPLSLLSSIHMCRLRTLSPFS